VPPDALSKAAYRQASFGSLSRRAGMPATTPATTWTRERVIGRGSWTKRCSWR